MNLKKRTRIFIVVLFFLSAALLVSARAASPDKVKPNVLLVVLDTLRSDHLGCYGYQKIKTPNIDNLARQGTLFKNVIAQVPLTCSSHASMFTSTYPQFNKVRDNGSHRLDESALTLAEVLRDHGYATAAFISSIVLDARYGLNQGFEIYDDRMPKRAGKKIIKFMDEERTADQITDAAVRWLRANKDKKFFLWAHYYDPHTIYNPPSSYKELYKDNLYDGEIAFADEQIGLLLAALKELDLDKNTLIIFTSDHGEGLGEHGEMGHAVFVYDAVLKVPLIFVYPGAIAEGKIIDDQVRLIDIMPTLLDFLLIKKNKEIQGESFFNLIKGRRTGIGICAYSESIYANIHFNWSRLLSWRKGSWKYIKSTEPELYDLKNDPGELNNLCARRQDVAEGLDKELEDFLKETTSEKKEKKIETDEQTRERLMSLGYVQGTMAAKTDEPVPRKMIQIMEKMNIADRLANEGLVEQAIVGYNEILRSDPNNIEAYVHLGQCYKEQEKYDEAIKYFKKAVSFKPDEPESHNGLGNIYKSMGKADEAFTEFQLALRMEPDDPALINNIGWCYQQKMDFDKAMEYYQKALKLDNNLPTAHANMAICFRAQGQLDKALEELKIALEQDPKLAFAYAELCACVATKGDLDSAIAHCQKAIELEPRATDGYINLGVCYERKKEYDKAIENYKEALEIAPWNTLVMLNMANVYVARKDFQTAKEYLEKVLKINPGSQKAQAMLKDTLKH